MPFWKKAILCVLAVELLGNASGLVTFFSLDGWYNALLIAIGMTIRAGYPVNRPVAALLLPYFLWVAYAAYLNAGFWILNR